LKGLTNYPDHLDRPNRYDLADFGVFDALQFTSATVLQPAGTQFVSGLPLATSHDSRRCRATGCSDCSVGVSCFVRPPCGPDLTATGFVLLT